LKNSCKLDLGRVDDLTGGLLSVVQGTQQTQAPAAGTEEDFDDME